MIFALAEGTRELQVWLLSGILAILVPSLAYFLVREFKRKDALGERVERLAEKMDSSVDKLTSAVATLTLAIHEIKVWSQDRFVSRPEFDASIERTKLDIAAHADRFARELDKCQDRCSSRCGD